MTPSAPFDLTPEQADAINALWPCQFVVGIRKNETGEVQFCPQEYEWNEEGSLYLWATGNYSCDCNRHLFFHEFTEDCYNDAVPCTETLYTVVGIWFPDGGEIRDLNEMNDF